MVGDLFGVDAGESQLLGDRVAGSVFREVLELVVLVIQTCAEVCHQYVPGRRPVRGPQRGSSAAGVQQLITTGGRRRPSVPRVRERGM